MDKKISRLRRAVPTRRKIAELRVHRLTVFRSNLHIYASVISGDGTKVIATASTALNAAAALRTMSACG